MAYLKVTMLLEVDSKDFEEVKQIENHADRLLSLDEWPEIKSVCCVTVEEEKK